MYIKSYQCTRFAGLKDTCIDFDKGLNVILGPNESGKSTIIEGIHSTLFKNIKLKNNNNADKDFSFRFMPKPKGSFIDSRLVLGTAKGQYEIVKEWGDNENIQLLTPSGNILKNEKDVNEELANVLGYGESTYSNIVFAKQRDLNQALKNIITNEEVTKEINNLLRMALMELDGISIDGIQKNIEDEIESLYKRWDREKNFPENNRGANNPYKTGLGEILKSYYNKENLRSEMEAADRSEKEFERISSEIARMKEQREILNKEKVQLESIEDDVNKRAILEAEMESISKELDRLMDINKEWPKVELRLEQKDESLIICQEEKDKLIAEKSNIEKLARKESLEKKLARIGELQREIEDLKDELSTIPSIENKDIDKLSQLQTEIMKCETSMQAGKMIGILKKSTTKPVYVVKDFEDRTALDVDVEFEANGLIKIFYADELEIEIKTGEIDFEELIEKYKSLKEEYKNLLGNLKISSIEEGKLNIERIKTKENEKRNLNRELSLILDGERIEEIEGELKTLGDIKLYRNKDEIEDELSKNSQEIIDVSADIQTYKKTLKAWEEKYLDQNSLFDIVVKEKSELNRRKEEVEKLKSLPEDFQTVDEFKERLTWLRDEEEQVQIQVEGLNEDYHQAKNNLSEDSYEELKKEFLDAEKSFDRNIHRGEKLLVIQKVFLETKERLASNPMESLAKEFARLLEVITNGIYKRGEIDEDFNIKIENPRGEIPIELLSAGTYDSVSLALRFSLLKHIFKDEGYVILDDCLVDLDPERKAQSIDLIKELSKDYQIIFTTCDPETASMLGGNLIDL